VDPAGHPSRDAEAFYAGGALLPLGGAVAGHKGYGLGLASALLGALGMIDDPEPAFAGVFLQVIDPAAFGDVARYRALVDETLDAAKRQRPADGVAEVLVPGEPEERARTQRTGQGIPLPAATWAELGSVAARFGVPLPPSGRSA
jgi:uncharacterized oxidoreductase